MTTISSGLSAADAGAPGHGFSVESVTLDPHAAQGRPTPIVVARFDPDDFVFDLFRAHGIACPDVILNSVKKRQAEFFCGRWAASLALAAIGQAAVDIPIGRSREPVWPAGVTGSISHADGIAVACACRSDAVRGVGIDIEQVPAGKVLREIEDLTSTAEERTYLAGLASAHPDLPVGLFHTLLFSVKESVFKALFATVGRDFDFKDMVLTQLDVPGRTITLGLTRTFATDLVRGQLLVAKFELLSGGVVLTGFSWQAQRLTPTTP